MNKRLQTKLLGCFLFQVLFPLVAIAKITYPALSETGLRNLESIRLMLQADCPPSTCIVAFVGRSNVLISAYMEAKGHKNLVNLPATGVRRENQTPNNQSEENFSKLVLEPILKPKLLGIEKIIVVDFVSTGKSLVRLSHWIQNFCKKLGSITIEARYYGGVPHSTLLDTLEKKGIKSSFLPSGGVREVGSLNFITQDSQTELHAPYGAWTPDSATSTPKIDPNLRRQSPYRDESNPGDTKILASYNDLIALFESDNPLEKLPKTFKTSISPCRAGLGADLL